MPDSGWFLTTSCSRDSTILRAKELVEVQRCGCTLWCPYSFLATVVGDISPEGLFEQAEILLRRGGGSADSIPRADGRLRFAFKTIVDDFLFDLRREFVMHQSHSE
jgi:hypothetical protein